MLTKSGHLAVMTAFISMFCVYVGSAFMWGLFYCIPTTYAKSPAANGAGDFAELID